MKYLKCFEDRKGIPNTWVALDPTRIIPPSDEEEEDLIDYLQEFFDKFSIKFLDDIIGKGFDDTNNYMVYHNNGASLSIDIYHDPNREAYKNLLDIRTNIERRLGYRLKIHIEDYSSSMSLYNIIIYKA